MSEYHPLVATIRALLDEHHFWYETFEHAPVRTSEEAAQIRTGYDLHQGAKALIIRVKPRGGEKFFAMVVVPGDQRFDSQKVLAFFDAKDIRFATPEEVSSVTNGVELGGVPPFGNLFDIPLVVDPAVLANEKIIFNAGDRGFSIAMEATDYKKLVSPQIRNVAQT